MCRNSVTEVQLHRAVAKRRRRVQSHGQHHDRHRETGFPAHYRLRLYASVAPRSDRQHLKVAFFYRKSEKGERLAQHRPARARPRGDHDSVTKIYMYVHSVHDLTTRLR